MSKGFASNYRIVLLAVGILGCFSVLGTRLVYLHVFDRAELLQYIERVRRQIIVEHARRGDILDSHGGILATSRSLIILGVDPQSLDEEDRAKWPQLAELIGRPLPELTRIFETKTRRVTPPAAPVPAGAGVVALPAFAASAATVPSVANASDPDAEDSDTAVEATEDENGERPIRWAKLREDVEESTYAKIQALGIRGVYGNRVYRRAYPHNSLAAHIIGYVNKAGDPAAGIERYADFYLHGRDGWREGERDGLRRELAQFRTRDVPP